MKKLISILQVYALIASLCSPALAGTATRVKADIFEGGDNAIPNPGAEGPAPLPVAFANPAGTAPTTMTGGSPGTTCTRVTGMDGMAFKMDLGSGASRQGEGCAFDAISIPKSMRGKTVAITFPFEVTGSIVEDDLKIYAYDNTNGELITPTWHQKILGLQGDALSTFPTKTNTASLTLGVFVARTATTALSLLIDNVKLSKSIPAMGMAGSDTVSVSLTPNSAAFGAVTNGDYRGRFVGDRWEVSGRFVAGTVSTGSASIALPSNIKIDPTKTSTAASGIPVGWYKRAKSGASADERLGAIIFDGTDVANVYFSVTSGSSAYTKEVGNTVLSSNDVVSFGFSIPVSSQSANVTMGQSSTWSLAGILANGVRVTSTPAKLGEYRAYQKSASGSSGTDAAPATSITAVDGLPVGSFNYATAGSGSFNIGRYEANIGKGRDKGSAALKCWGGTGHAQSIDTGHFANSTWEQGAFFNYDQTTGLVIVDFISVDSSGIGTRRLGSTIPTGGASVINPSTGYCDVIVSENALAVGMQMPRSSVTLDTANGYGSTNTNVMRFANVTATGTDLLVAQSSTLGDSVTTLSDGLYSVKIQGQSTAIGDYLAVMNGKTTVSTVTGAANLAMFETTGTNRIGSASDVHFLPAGTVLMGVNSTTNTLTSLKMKITKVSN